MNTSPLLSVLIITYNHEKFIQQAIDGVLAQRTDFDYEIVIGEDCSTDNTRGILLEYYKKYPDKIKLILQEKNVGSNLNFIDTYIACKGKYLALLEGDDYWTDSAKLQKQVNFLESNSEFVIYCHDVAKLFDDDCVDAPIIAMEQNNKEVSDIKDLLNGNIIYTASSVFLKVVKQFPPWFADCMLTDWLLWLLTTEHGGKIFYSKEKMAVYRIHNGGMYSTNNSMPYAKQVEINKGIIYQVEKQIEYFDNHADIKRSFEKSLILRLNKLRILALKNSDYKLARFSAQKLMRLLIKEGSNYKILISTLMSYFLPELHSKYLIERTG